tara:strand:- start:831 stop:1904 length:1074 start_codon:yes stop_codon:yes gene_type:complete
VLKDYPNLPYFALYLLYICSTLADSVLHMEKIELYKPNIKKIDKICKDLGIVRSKFHLSITMKGLGLKYFSQMMTDQKKFTSEIFEELARNFNNLYQEQKKTEVIDYEELFINEQKNESNEKTIYLERTGSYFDHRGMIGLDLVFNRCRVTNDIAGKIHYLFEALDQDSERGTKFSKNFFSVTEQLAEIKDKGRINSIIESLHIDDGVNVFMGHLYLPQISYMAEEIPGGHSCKVSVIDIHMPYRIVLFSDEPDIEYFKFKYNEKVNLSQVRKFVDKFPHNFEHAVEFGKKILINYKGELHNNIINKIADHYVSLEIDFDPEFQKIIPDFIDLPFSWVGFEKIIPIKRIKKNNDKQN